MLVSVSGYVGQELDKMDEASGIDNFINLKLDGVEVAFTEGQDIQTWKLPAAGMLRFDYVATKRVPKEAKAQRHEVRLSAGASTYLYLHLSKACCSVVVLRYSCRFARSCRTQRLQRRRSCSCCVLRRPHTTGRPRR